MDTNNETVPEGCNASSDYPWGLRENCFSLLDLQRLPLGIARKIAITKKKKKQQAHDGRWEEEKDVSFSLPLPIVLRALLFYPSPQPPSDTMRPLRSREELFGKHIQKEFKRSRINIQ